MSRSLFFYTKFTQTKINKNYYEQNFFTFRKHSKVDNIKMFNVNMEMTKLVTFHCYNLTSKHVYRCISLLLKVTHILSLLQLLFTFCYDLFLKSIKFS